ncbi:MAG TPA: dTDP-4-dehydrorhamnose 3,5-epimerase [Thermoanaerobaculia bacterium]|nr:dTDP-4-dehydrorhamnose 3,5-epimerase [Thermoanaerobaculia bacterium]
MSFTELEIPGVILVEPRVFPDERGFFLETFHEQKYRAGGIPESFVQDNHSRSVKGTLRGLHSQRHQPQGKLVRAIEGRIFDVAVDVRRGSPTFRRWVGVELSAENFLQLYIPQGFVHGFCVLSDVAQVEYKCTDYYAPHDEQSVRWNDPDIGIAWPITDPVISPKDHAAPRLSEIEHLLPVYGGV